MTPIQGGKNGQIKSLKTQNYLACNEASQLLQCIITEKQSNQINTLQ